MYPDCGWTTVSALPVVPGSLYTNFCFHPFVCYPARSFSAPTCFVLPIMRSPDNSFSAVRPSVLDTERSRPVVAAHQTPRSVGFQGPGAASPCCNAPRTIRRRAEHGLRRRGSSCPDTRVSLLSHTIRRMRSDSDFASATSVPSRRLPRALRTCARAVQA